MSNPTELSFTKSLKEFRNLGCTNTAKCATACKTFMVSKTNQSYRNLEKFFNQSLDVIYFKGQVKNSKNNDLDTILPVLETDQVDFQTIEKLQESSQSDSITIAVSDCSSNVLYYTVSQGFVDK